MKDNFGSIHQFLIRITMTMGMSIGLAVVLAGSANAQIQHHMSSGHEAPGLVAQKKMLENPNLGYVKQPVQIITPDGSSVAMWSSQGFAANGASTLNVGLTIGHVYRMQVTNIPRFFDKEVYPSIEVIDRLHPPEGMENHLLPVTSTL